MQPSTDETRRLAYYDAALGLLRFVEQRSPTARRFGAEADALWRSFAGDLDPSDRIELLLRDADRQWAGAFAARAVFARRSAHEQDAFGSTWTRLSSGEAQALWTSTLAGPPVADGIAGILRSWKLQPAAFETAKLRPSARVVIAGLAAISACLRQFLANPDLSWPNQVVVVAADPGPRQLAAAAAALLDQTQPTLLIHPEQLSPAHREAVHARLGATLEAIISPDATAHEREVVAELAAAPSSKSKTRS
jgi:hypothetical protein